MAGILDGLNTAKLALSAQQYAMSVTQRNAVNVNNPNYTRQDVLFKDLTVTSSWASAVVPGVELSAARNNYLDKSIGYELPELGESLVKYNALLEIDAILRGTSGGGLGTSINKFFNSFTELSSSPTDSALRWQTLSTAQTMVQDFNRLYNDIQRVQTSASQHMDKSVEDVNNLTGRIADLNGRIKLAHNAGQLENELGLRDERRQYIEELENKINLLYFETESGSITITTTQGEALVLEDRNSKIKADVALGNGFFGISLNGQDITATITSGEIGGYLQVRDALIPGYLKTLDEMAAGIITKVNAVHGNGYDLDGAAGGKFLESATFDASLGADITAVARDIKVVLSDPRKVAAAGDNGSGASKGVGDNTNAKALAAIGVGELVPGSTVGEMYASMVYKVGSDQLAAKESGEKQQNVLNQLYGQRDSISGVSFNEEAINLIKYQRAYQASASIVSVLNSLSAELLNLLR